MADNCATCGSHAPHLHPSISVGGEVSICSDSFHLERTPQNDERYIKMVLDNQKGVK